jgi:hypothetical protein
MAERSCWLWEGFGGGLKSSKCGSSFPSAKHMEEGDGRGVVGGGWLLMLTGAL